MSNNEIDNILSLTDEDGNIKNFEFVDLIDYLDKQFIVLIPCEDSDEAEEVVILEIDNTEANEESFCSVEDDNTLNAVFEIFKEKFKDEFNFVD